MVQLYDALNGLQFHFGSFVARVKFDCFLEFVLGTAIVTMVSQNNAPNDPVIHVFRHFLNAFLDFLHGLAHFAPLKQRKSPMSVAVMLVHQIQLGLAAYVYSLRVELMQIEQKRQVVIHIPVCRVDLYAFAPMVHCLTVQLKLEIGHAQVVMDLGFFITRGGT